MNNTRPCIVSDRRGGEERKALFHCWNHWAVVIDASPFEGGHPAGQMAQTYAIVEFEDGTVRNVNPELVRFITKRNGDRERKVTFEELEKEVARKLMESEISPEEFVKQYNEMLKEDSKKHVELMEPHEHI